MPKNQKGLDSSYRKFMFLKLGEAKFAIPLSQVREVLGLGQMTSLPNMPSYFAGLINLRGKIVSAVDLRKSLNFVEGTQTPQDSVKRPCVVITEIEGRIFGAIVDDVVEVQAFNESDVDHSVDSLSYKDMFDGLIKFQGASLAPILNLKRALRIDELIVITARDAA